MTYEKVKPPIMAEMERTSENKVSNEELLREGGKRTKPCKPWNIHISEELIYFDRMYNYSIQQKYNVSYIIFLVATFKKVKRNKWN